MYKSFLHPVSNYQSLWTFHFMKAVIIFVTQIYNLVIMVIVALVYDA